MVHFFLLGIIYLSITLRTNFYPRSFDLPASINNTGKKYEFLQ